MAQIGPDRAALSTYTGAALRVSSRRRRTIGFSEDSPAAVHHFGCATAQSQVIITLERYSTGRRATDASARNFCPAPYFWSRLAYCTRAWP
jgi:hypothetical protein